MALTTDELTELLTDLESDRVERTVSTTNIDKLSEVICAFANDLPGHGKPGVLFVGASDDGRPCGLPVTDGLLRRLSDMRDQGNILPPPSMRVDKVNLAGVDVAIVEVQDGQAPTADDHPCCLAQLKHYRSLMPLAQEARKPMFALKPADGAFGGHFQAAQRAHQDFQHLATAILTHLRTSAG